MGVASTPTAPPVPRTDVSSGDWDVSSDIFEVAIIVLVPQMWLQRYELFRNKKNIITEKAKKRYFYLDDREGELCHGGAFGSDVDRGPDALGELLEGAEGVAHDGMAQGGDDVEELDVLDGLETEGTTEVVLKEFAGYLDDTDAGGDGLAGEVGLVDKMRRLETKIVSEACAEGCGVLYGV